MKYALYTHFDSILMREGAEAVCRYAADRGFSGVEHLEDISPCGKMSVPTMEDAKELRKTLDKYGLDMACLSIAANVWTNKSEVENLKKQAEFAAALGSPFLHHTCLPWLKTGEDAPSAEEGFECAVKAAVEVSQYAARFGLNTLYEEQGLYLNGCEGFGKFLYEVRRLCPSVGVCGDMGNIRFVTETPEAFFEQFKGDIRHVHVKAYQTHTEKPASDFLCYELRDGSWIEEVSPVLCPETMKNLMGLLKEASYNGYYALELSRWDDFDTASKQTMTLLDSLA